MDDHESKFQKSRSFSIQKIEIKNPNLDFKNGSRKSILNLENTNRVYIRIFIHYHKHFHIHIHNHNHLHLHFHIYYHIQIHLH